jgi:hypothetical protein
MNQVQLMDDSNPTRSGTKKLIDLLSSVTTMDETHLGRTDQTDQTAETLLPLLLGRDLFRPSTA